MTPTTRDTPPAYGVAGAVAATRVFERLPDGRSRFAC